MELNKLDFEPIFLCRLKYVLYPLDSFMVSCPTRSKNLLQYLILKTNYSNQLIKGQGTTYVVPLPYICTYIFDFDMSTARIW